MSSCKHDTSRVKNNNGGGNATVNCHASLVKLRRQFEVYLEFWYFEHFSKKTLFNTFFSFQDKINSSDSRVSFFRDLWTRTQAKGIRTKRLNPKLISKDNFRFSIFSNPNYGNILLQTKIKLKNNNIQQHNTKKTKTATTTTIQQQIMPIHKT